MSSSELEPGREDEQTRLIQQRPPSYRSHDRGTSPSSSIASIDDDDDSDSILSSSNGPANKLSRADLVWVLAGLWSAVFLGALDGLFPLSSLWSSTSVTEAPEQEPSLRRS